MSEDLQMTSPSFVRAASDYVVVVQHFPWWMSIARCPLALPKLKDLSCRLGGPQKRNNLNQIVGEVRPRTQVLLRFGRSSTVQIDVDGIEVAV